jgi:glycosyltransferase involved in cell wall biosynthesis
MWDFFPDHHRSIALIRDGWPFAIARRLEPLIHRFDVIDCMSPRNVAYLQDHCGLRPNQCADILPIWARTETPPTMSREHARTAFGLPHDKTIVVHVGQITEGRGIDDILAAAAIAQRKHSSLTFLLIGEGRLTGAINARIAEGADNVIYRLRIPRQDYLSVVSACDVGIVCTVGNVDVPTFPSKIIDYLRVGLPVVASVQTSTDYGRFIENNGVGLAVGAGDPRAMVGAIAHDGVVRKRMAATGRRVLTECFYVQRVAARLLGSLSPLPSDALAHGPAA